MVRVAGCGEPEERGKENRRKQGLFGVASLVRLIMCVFGGNCKIYFYLPITNLGLVQYSEYAMTLNAEKTL